MASVKERGTVWYSTFITKVTMAMGLYHNHFACQGRQGILYDIVVKMICHWLYHAIPKSAIFKRLDQYCCLYIMKSNMLLLRRSRHIQLYNAYLNGGYNSTNSYRGTVSNMFHTHRLLFRDPNNGHSACIGCCCSN